jgi:hypothetical protein
MSCIGEEEDMDGNRRSGKGADHTTASALGASPGPGPAVRERHKPQIGVIDVDFVPWLLDGIGAGTAESGINRRTPLFRESTKINANLR